MQTSDIIIPTMVENKLIILYKSVEQLTVKAMLDEIMKGKLILCEITSNRMGHAYFLNELKYQKITIFLQFVLKTYVII